MTLPLAASIEAQWKGFNAKLRNQIRKSELSGLSIRVGGGTESVPSTTYLRETCAIWYSRVYRHCSRVCSTHFPEACRVFTVRDDRHVVAGSIAVAHRDTLEVPWAASRRDALPRCPNHRLVLGIDSACDQGRISHFDFGRSSPGSGPYKFKEQWGAKEVPQYWEYWTATGNFPIDAPESSLCLGRSRLETVTAEYRQLDRTLDCSQYSLKVHR